MAAVVRQVEGRKWQAYCEEHGDGRNGQRGAVNDWADQHNKKEHPSEFR